MDHELNISVFNEIQLKFHHAMWIHGVDAQLGFKAREPHLIAAAIQQFIDTAVVTRSGTGTRIEVLGSEEVGDFVVHLPISTQNVVSGGGRLSLKSLMLDFDASSNVAIKKVEAWDGNLKIASFGSDPLPLSGKHSIEIFEVTNHPIISRGINISATLHIDTGKTGIIEIHAGGINVISVTRSGLVKQVDD